MANVTIEIVDLATGKGIPATLDADYVGHPGMDWHAVTNNNGVFPAGLSPGDYVIRVASPEYVPYDWSVHIENDGTIRQGLLRATNTDSNSIAVAGHEFIVNGGRYKPKGCTDFLLVYKKSQGIDIRPILEQRKNAGMDMLRILTCCFNIAKFDPRQLDVAAFLDSTLDDIHSFDMRAEVEGFADVQLLGLSDAECQAHHNSMSNVVWQHGSVDLYDLCNEFDKNGIDPTKFSKPHGIVSSSGSKMNNKPPTQPYWDFGTYHPRRDGEDYYFAKWLSDMTPQCEIYNGVEGELPFPGPVLPDEPKGFQSTVDPGRRSNYPGFAYRVGSIYSMFLNGSFFHSTQGIFSDMFDARTMECAIAFARGCDDARGGW